MWDYLDDPRGKVFASFMAGQIKLSPLTTTTNIQMTPQVTHDTKEKDMESFEKFEKAVTKARAASNTVGTVVRWKSGGFNYAAIWAGSRWWITGAGRFYGKTTFTNSEFLKEVVETADDFEVATEWNQY